MVTCSIHQFSTRFHQSLSGVSISSDRECIPSLGPPYNAFWCRPLHLCSDHYMPSLFNSHTSIYKSVNFQALLNISWHQSLAIVPILNIMLHANLLSTLYVSACIIIIAEVSQTDLKITSSVSYMWYQNPISLMGFWCYIMMVKNY